ncbi:Transmembrane protein TauE-like [Acididesulfobacillus acetoxydans]|uniref:Probable membrane transporter protein n=1 Tax=Acididesulfobacillus acetoxydans TaxID=1561005 RepID=A0A8S0XB26_9FIRM|nr:TSUP family transporter [Acididesulfobacillus acetoxydans]CAA7600676.1 Transmembrane protein TauE-like [Acididesulfobacillus acetoxydans]CEJ09457.1 Sulfite exporter TauE/SafE [Acididesulfobacillus acetoxydans]
MIFHVAGVTVNPIVIIIWMMFVGFVFSTIGAAGGILAGVGHITIFGMKKANVIKPMNQILTLVSPVISTPLYLREKRLVIPAAVTLGLGGIIGALIGSWLSHTYLPDMKSYQPLFGLITFVIAGRMWYELTPRFRDKQQVVKKATKAFESKVKELKAAGKLNEIKEIGVNFSEMGINNTFSFAGETFRYNAFAPFLAGMFVAIISAALGVGGGFLLVPFLSSMLGFPMFIVAGTSTMSILISSLTSIGNYLRMGSHLDFAMIGFELIGILIGSYLGPTLSKYIKGVYLKAFLAVVLTYIGIGYVFGPLILHTVGIKII